MQKTEQHVYEGTQNRIQLHEIHTLVSKLLRTVTEN